MTTFLSQMHNRMRARSAYRRTVQELRNLPIDTALDLGIHREDARRIARRAVYGV